MKGFRDLLEAYYDYRPFKSIIINKIIGNGSKVLNLFGNFIIPIEFILTKPKKNIPIADGTIISMTSFPKRINKIWIVIECLIRQTFRAEKIILYLSKEQFQNKQTLPKKIIDYETNGFLFSYDSPESFRDCLKKLKTLEVKQDDIIDAYRSIFSFDAGVIRLKTILSTL